ncbi:unnamed protein product [Bursaphelenchus xylophilus]|uniref:(pine wood nematode) hypothetical protein n=1 Tax=Bursaphelenchus xylophilus TaxID=6326 RepID=A0A7I8XIJ4_BURXY|nr:unnamed protein product [Bursaphelenchus xylophilus]CAG9085748.1 unnamed protein product [Bursaphelenchus xylophilus]
MDSPRRSFAPTLLLFCIDSRPALGFSFLSPKKAFPFSESACGKSERGFEAICTAKAPSFLSSKLLSALFAASTQAWLEAENLNFISFGPMLNPYQNVWNR